MNSIVIVYSGGRSWGGIETYLSNLFELYDRERMRLVLVSMGRWKLTDELERKGLGNDVRILSSKRVRAKTVWAIRRIVRDESASLVVSQGVVANAYARLAIRGTGAPSLAVVHSDIKLDYAGVLKRYAYESSDRLLRSATTSYIAVSRYLKERLVSAGVEPASVRVIYNGVKTEADQRAPQYADAKQRSGSANEVQLVSVGRLHKVKNFDSLVRAVPLLPETVRLTIWGEGEERANLEDLVSELGLVDRVRFPGESENMRQVLVETDIYLQPSWSEGCSFAVAEAMLQAKPTVVTPYGGLPEQVRNGVTGLVAADGSPEQLAKSTQLLLSDHDLEMRLGLAGRKAARDMYSVTKWLEETTTALCETAKAKDRSQ